MKDSLIIVVGKSGTGKSSLVDTLCMKRGYNNIKSYTTRKPRVNDYTHHFISKDELIQYQQNDLIYSQDYLFDNIYFTTKKDIDSHHFYITSPKSAIELQDKLGGLGYKLLTIYFECDEETRIDRLIKRGDNYQSILNRMEEEKHIFKDFHYDKKIDTNNTFNCNYNQLKKYSILFYKK